MPQLDIQGLLGSILNPAVQPPRSASASGLIPGGGSDEADQSAIQQIIASLNAPEQQPGLLQTLLPAIAQAISVGFSEKPAEQLGDVLKQRATTQEREKERRERVKQLGAQLQIEDILQRGKERRAEAIQVRGEARAEKREFGAEFRASLRDVAKFNREAGFQEKMANLSFDQNKKLADIKNNYDVENAKTLFGNQKELENLRSSNNRLEQKIGQELSFIQPLIYSKYFGGKDASALYDKVARGEKLTAEESAKITKAYDGMRNEKYKQELAIANVRARSVGGESPITKGIEWAQGKATTNVIGQDAQGQYHELQKNMVGEYAPVDPNVKITKYLSQGETFRYFLDFYSKTHPEVQGLFGQIGSDIPDEKALSVKLDQVISTAINQKTSQGDIIKNLNDPLIQRNLGVTPQMVQQAIERNKLSPEGTSIPLTPMAGLTSEVQAVSEIPATAGIKEGMSASDIEKRLKEDRTRFNAANTISFLTDKRLRLEEQKTFRQYKTSPRFRDEVARDIVDTERRLEDAYKAHPELRPK